MSLLGHDGAAVAQHVTAARAPGAERRPVGR